MPKHKLRSDFPIPTDEVLHKVTLRQPSGFVALPEQGDDKAQFLLAGAYFFGQGVPRDYLEAHKWADLAVSRAPDEKTRESRRRMLGLIAEKLKSGTGSRGTEPGAWVETEAGTIAA